MIDSHCHLADEVFESDLDAVVARAKAAGIERALVILEAGSMEEERRAGRLARLWPESRVAVGVHPHGAHAFAGEATRAAAVARAAVGRHDTARAIGEIGLDYHYDHSPRDVQVEVFRAQVQLARDLELPVVIHTREADADTLRVLEEDGRGEIRGVLHCFSGTPELARAGLGLGLYLSFAGIVTFARARELREIAKTVPLDRVLLETDSPFLAPVPHRGTRNEPALVVQVAAMLAALHQTDLATIDARTTANFHTLFRP